MAAFDRIVKRAFSGGEQSPTMDARADLQRWQTAMRAIENFICMVQGGVTRRSGTRDVREALADSQLLPFAFSDNDAYAVEAAEEVMRFHRDFGTLLDGDDPFELETPFSADEVAGLDYAQSADQLFIASGARAIQRLSRLAETNWTIEDLPVRLGPFLDDNTEGGITLSTSTNTDLPAGMAGIALVATAPLFDPLHVGALFKIAVIQRNKYPLWAPGLHLTVGDNEFRYWGDNLYKLTAKQGGSNVASGQDPPVHGYGKAWDGQGGDSNLGYEWQFVHAGWGVLEITAVADSTHATAVAKTYIPRDLYDGTWRWAEGAWSEYQGYPSVVCFHEKRLVAGKTTRRPNRFWGSVIDDYPNFKQGTLATDAYSYDLQGASNKVNAIRWLVSGGRLNIGTSGDEFAVPTSSTREPVTPENIVVDNATEEGSRPIKPVKIGNPIFISGDGKRLHEMTYDFQADAYVAPDLTIFADHMPGDGASQFAQLAWQRDPYRLLWARRTDGVLVSITYRKDQQITAWHRHPTPKGIVKSICTVPSPSGIRDDLWLIVERTTAAGVSRRIECLMPFFERGDLDIKGGWFVDCGFTYAGAPATLMSNIPAFLEGESVTILADGKVHQAKRVTAGAVTLNYAASKVILGLGFSSRLETLRYDRDVQGGALAGKKTRIAGIVLDLLRAACVKIGAGTRAPEYAKNTEGQIMNAALPLFTGATRSVPVESGWEDNGVATVACDDPLPATIRALTLDLQVAG